MPVDERQVGGEADVRVEVHAAAVGGLGGQRAQRVEAPVEGLVVNAVVGVGEGGHATRLVARRRRVLDLDDLGPQVPQKGHAERPRTELGHGEDPEPVERE